MTVGRAVVVTPGAAGIGLSIAEAFAANSDRVHICDINPEALTHVADVRVNNAGISGPTAPIETMEPGQRQSVLAVNLTGRST